MKTNIVIKEEVYSKGDYIDRYQKNPSETSIRLSGPSFEVSVDPSNYKSQLRQLFGDFIVTDPRYDVGLTGGCYPFRLKNADLRESTIIYEEVLDYTRRLISIPFGAYSRESKGQILSKMSDEIDLKLEYEFFINKRGTKFDENQPTLSMKTKSEQEIVFRVMKEMVERAKKSINEDNLELKWAVGKKFLNSCPDLISKVFAGYPIIVLEGVPEGFVSIGDYSESVFFEKKYIAIRTKEVNPYPKSTSSEHFEEITLSRYPRLVQKNWKQKPLVYIEVNVDEESNN